MQPVLLWCARTGGSARCLSNITMVTARHLTSHPASEDPSAEPKPFSSIPGPRVWPVFGSGFGFLLSERGSIHKYFDNLTKQYGEIYKVERAPARVVFVQDVKYLRKMYQHEGKYPRRNEIQPWELYRRIRGFKDGIILGNGEEWYKLRHAMNSYMLRTSNVASHTGDFNDVTTDFMKVFDALVNERGDGKVDNLKDILFNWGMESAGSLIFDERLGCLSDDPPADILLFIQALQDVLKTTETLIFVPPKLARSLHLSIWTKHERAWDILFQSAERILLHKMKAIQSELSEGKEVSGLVASLMQNKELDEDDVISSTLDLMTAAVDTTSGTSMWILYLLSKHPNKQQLLVDEISRVLPSGGLLGQQGLRDMPYLKAVVKETLRLFPVSPFVNRTVSEDIVIAGYHIPKGVNLMTNLWTIGRDPEVYEDPESFKPERWIRGNQEREDIDPYAHLAFGHGVRSCVGRRVAELDIYLLVTRMLQKYRLVDTSPGTEIESLTGILLVPKTDLNIAYIPREDNL